MTTNKTKQNKSSKFLSGALAGAALAVAVGIFASSKAGKEMKKEVKSKMAEFYRYLAPQLKKVKAMGEKEYKLLVGKALASYNKNKKFSRKDLENIKKEAHAFWKHMKKHL